ncbi:hypothetical protein CHELA1G11_10216 [Hyphomicrobiales bacterium]|nr:hypothetical protein CHELA1G11_10216 [Hyphomicrobiales bacterium]CAH1676245.1 hypothetical protein CHELA1G2_14092 [Hyphomicrobiales bacterium]
MAGLGLLHPIHGKGAERIGQTVVFYLGCHCFACTRSEVTAIAKNRAMDVRRRNAWHVGA